MPQMVMVKERASAVAETGVLDIVVPYTTPRITTAGPGAEVFSSVSSGSRVRKSATFRGTPATRARGLLYDNPGTAVVGSPGGYGLSIAADRRQLLKPIAPPPVAASR